MKIGVHLVRFTMPGGPAAIAPTLAAVGRAADEVGVANLSLMDHYFQIGVVGAAEEPMLEGYTSLGFLAAHNTSAELQLLVTGVTYRHPGLLAKIVSTLDVLSGGRAALGIGAAWYEREHAALGVRYPPVAERFERLEETLQIVRQMWSEDNGPFEGKHYQLAETLNSPQPLRSPHPPIMIGGGGEKRTLRLVAELADMCNVSGSATTVAHKLDVLRAHCDAVGRDPGAVTTTRMGTLVLTPDVDESARVRSFLSGMAGEAYAEQFTVGQADDVVRDVEALLATGVDALIFNMPLSDPDTVARAGELLTSTFAPG